MFDFDDVVGVKVGSFNDGVNTRSKGQGQDRVKDDARGKE